MSGTTSFLFQGQPTPPQPTGSDTSTSYPLWLQQYTSNLANAATNLASTPYTAYPGQQVATPSNATQQSWNMALGNVGNYQPALNTAQTLTGQAATPISSSDINSYMDPYMGQVIGGLTSAANTNLFQNQLPAIQDRFVSAGQSRSPQEMQATNNALYQSNQALDQGIAGALGQGYQGALSTALAEQQAEQTAGAQYGQLGALTQQLGAGDVGLVGAAGQTQDVNNQANINAALNNFYSQQQWPYQNLAFASNIIRGQAVPSNTQVTGTSYNPSASYTTSPLSTFAGTLAAGNSILGNGTSSGTRVFRRGGHVQQRRAPPAGALNRAAFARAA